MGSQRQFGVLVLGLAALALLLGGSEQAQAGPVGYQFDVTTSYLASGSFPGDTINPTSSADTGLLTVTNNGNSTFTGTITLSGTAADGSGPSGNDIGNSFFGPGTLAPGQHVDIAANNTSGNLDSSNSKGYNGTFGTTENGKQVSIVGNVALGASSEAVNLSVFDSAITSGPFYTDVLGNMTNAYVLQGGDPLGGDPGDPAEEAQASGHFQFLETTVPEPASVLLFGAALTGLAAFSRRWRKQAA